MKLLLPFFLLALTPLIGCESIEPSATTRVTQGFLQGEHGQIWYRTVGNPNAGTPLLLLHGGPGAGSRPFEPLEAIGEERMVVFYDQLGAGRSEKPNDPSLWTIERHLQEVDFVRQQLGLDSVHVLGHSWGSMLLTEYLLTEPEGVVSATFASPLFSTARWIEDAKQRVTEMPEDIQQAIRIHEAAGTTDSEEYQQAVGAFYSRYMLRADPWPEAMSLAFDELGVDVYNYMWGPSEFNASGTLADWDRMDVLPNLDLPTLFTVGEFDETYPSTVQAYADAVPGSSFVEISGAAHVTFLDAPEENVAVVRNFLNSVDGHN